MFMFGKVTQAEYERIVAQGWEVERKPTQAEVNEFCEPHFLKGNPSWEPDEPDDEFFVLVCVDSDIEKNLTAWHEEAQSYRRLDDKVKLSKLRDIAADEALADFDFHDCEYPIGEDDNINDTGNWASDGPDRRIITVYYGDKSKDDPSLEGSYRGSFIVEFAPNTADIIDKHESME